MTTPILDRILADGPPDVLRWLADELEPTDLQSLLLAVYERRAGQRGVADVARQLRDNRFVLPSRVDPRTLASIERVVFDVLGDAYELTALSPLAPLGACAAMATVHQDKVVSTVRNTEVMSDPSNVLALIAAEQRRRERDKTVRLASTQRVVRAQAFHQPGFTAHFQILAMATAGRGRESWTFERDALRDHISRYLTILDRLNRSGFDAREPAVDLTPLHGDETRLVEEVGAWLGERFPAIPVAIDHARARGRGYYLDSAFQIRVTNADGVEIELIDGGFTDWTRQLLGDRKERLLISGMGIELIGALFARAAEGT